MRFNNGNDFIFVKAVTLCMAWVGLDYPKLPHYGNPTVMRIIRKSHLGPSIPCSGGNSNLISIQLSRIGSPCQIAPL
jgi:hypothetical protein